MTTRQFVDDDQWPLIIRAFREDFGLTQKELGVELKLGENTQIVYQWESTHRKPKQYLFLALLGLALVLRREGKLKADAETWVKFARANAA